jgi:F-type H+-transporting ATPase subunit gamma
MANIKEIAGKISSISSTQQITKAMKMVAASKLSKVQSKTVHMKQYVAKLASIVSSISETNGDEFITQYLDNRSIKKVLFVVMASDKGLCGSFNANTIKYANQEIKKIKSTYHNVEVDIMSVGEKVNQTFVKQGFKCITNFVESINKLSHSEANDIANFVSDAFLSKKYDKIILIYSNFKSVASQEPVGMNYLPIDFSQIANLSCIKESGITYIYEPSKKEIIQVLVPKLLEIQIYSALLESSSSEHSARMMTMSKASDNAGEMLKSLKITYNRTRQAAITQEISEIVSGAESLAK